MNPIIRSILGILAGIVVVPVVVMLMEGINGELYPLEGVDRYDVEAVKRATAEQMKTLPLGGFLMILLAWQASALVGGALAAWIADRLQVLHAGAIGCFVLLATLANFLMLRGHPAWVVAAGLILPIPVSTLAGKLVTPGGSTGQIPHPSRAGKK